MRTAKCLIRSRSLKITYSRTLDWNLCCFYPWDISISHNCTSPWERLKMNSRTSVARWPHVDPWRHWIVIMTSPRRISANSGFSLSLVHVLKIHYSCGGGIEKSVPHDHHLSIIWQASWCQSVILWTDFPIMMDSYILKSLLFLIDGACILSLKRTWFES